MNDEFINAQERILTSSFDKAKSYTQIILGIGYVSIFASWGFTREFLTKEEILWSAFLVVISIAFFVINEIFLAFINSRSILGLASAVQNPEMFLQIIEEKTKSDRKYFLIYARVWAVCFFVSFFTGIGSASILLWAFVHHLWAGS